MAIFQGGEVSLCLGLAKIVGHQKRAQRLCGGAVPTVPRFGRVVQNT